MLFYLSPSFGDQIIKGDRESIDCLKRILDSRKRGLLLIYASSLTFEKLIAYFDSKNDEDCSLLLKTISKKSRQKKQLLNDLTTFFVISSNKSSTPKKRGKIVFVTPYFANNSNIFYPPILLGENLSDCEFYANRITKNYTNDLPTSLTDIVLSDRFEPGGGNSTHNSYRRHKSKGIDLCFCIVDSDRKHPKENLGTTAKFVLDADEDSQSPLCRTLVIDMYSAENLLPLDEIERQFIIDKSQQQIESFETIKRFRSKQSWKHLPLKKGLKGKDFKINSESNQYWVEQLEQVGVNLPCCDIKECNCSLVPSISDKTLATALNNNDIPWNNYLNREENSHIKNDYSLITKELRSWLCRGSDIRT